MAEDMPAAVSVFCPQAVFNKINPVLCRAWPAASITFLPTLKILHKTACDLTIVIGVFKHRSILRELARSAHPVVYFAVDYNRDQARYWIDEGVHCIMPGRSFNIDVLKWGYDLASRRMASIREHETTQALHIKDIQKISGSLVKREAGSQDGFVVVPIKNSTSQPVVNIHKGGRCALTFLIRANPMTAGLLQDEDFTVGDIIGEGKNAIVADALFDGQHAALKILKDNNNESFAALQREINILKKIHSPHILKILDGLVRSGRPYFAMESLENTLREDIIMHSPFDEDTVMRVMVHICQAIDMHASIGIVHQDIKPSNIMRRGDEYVLIDYDSSDTARQAEPVIADNLKPINVGTPYYMSPEQCMGLGCTTATDIYCLGVVCWEMLYGKRMFTGNDTQDILMKHVREKPVPPCDSGTKIAPVIEAMLGKSMKERPQSGAEVIDMLRAHRPPDLQSA